MKLLTGSRYSLPDGDRPVYKLDDVKWVERGGLGFDDEFNLRYAGGVLEPLTDLDLERSAELRRLITVVAYGPPQGSA